MTVELDVEYKWHGGGREKEVGLNIMQNIIYHNQLSVMLLHLKKPQINRQFGWYNSIFSSAANLAKHCSAMESSSTNYKANVSCLIYVG